MAGTVAIGIQQFNEIRKKGYFYIDKTAFIREWWEKGDSVTLITRPRRFGKTLTMSMVEQFFSVKYAGQQNLFEDKGVSGDSGYLSGHQSFVCESERAILRVDKTESL